MQRKSLKDIIIKMTFLVLDISKSLINLALSIILTNSSILTNLEKIDNYKIRFQTFITKKIL